MWDDFVEEEPAQPAPGAEGEVPAEVEVKPEEAEPPPPEEPVKGTDQKTVYKHWVRPKFLQYTYLYDYQHNYYDDVINYLDRRNRGYVTEKPRAQTWGERVLRTYIAKNCHNLALKKDAALLHQVSTGARFHRYHSKSLISRKYSHLGFNTVSI